MSWGGKQQVLAVEEEFGMGDDGIEKGIVAFAIFYAVLLRGFFRGKCPALPISQTYRR